MGDFSLPCLRCGGRVCISAEFVSRAVDLGSANLFVVCACGAQLQLTNDKAGRREGFWNRIVGAVGGNL